MSKLVCPNCGYTEGGLMKTIGGAAVAVGIGAGIGLLIGGPVGAAVGGGFGGKLAQRLVNKCCAEVGKGICWRCPKCDSGMKEVN